MALSPAQRAYRNKKESVVIINIDMGQFFSEIVKFRSI
jgi:hypothetical protein